MPEKENFFKQYAHCAAAEVLEVIWEAKENDYRALFLDNEDISDLSPVSEVPYLHTLACRHTRVSDLKPLSDLKDLQYLYCSNTEVYDLSPILHMLEKGSWICWDEEYDGEKNIFVVNCPLTSPPIPIAQQGNAAILRWFEEQKRVGTQKVNEARLLLLGQGGSGKTTLKEKLRDKNAKMPEPDASTIGIEVTLLPLLYRYKFMPTGILTQLTCRLHYRIEHAGTPVPAAPDATAGTGVPVYMVWSDAVQFVDKSGTGCAFARELQSEHSIEITAFGAQKADILNQVVDILDDIHANSKYGNLRFEKLVPCPCPECANRRSRQEEAEFFNYDFLLELLREGETESDRCRLSKRKFPIRDILKNAQVRIFKIEQIHDLIAADQIERALNLLCGKFDDDHEIIQQMSRLNGLEREQRLGVLSENEYIVQKNRIRYAVLKTLATVTG